MNIYKYIVLAVIILIAFFYVKNNFNKPTDYENKVQEIERDVDSMSIDDLWSEITATLSE